ncbi:MAG: hypothetical protein HY923_06010 [Elusimicrobia bacterium]|nr:hypothetical protein [Elusimicrobiota bacterium]
MRALLLAFTLAPRALAADLLPQAAAQIEKLEALVPLYAERSGWVGAKDAAAYCVSSPVTLTMLPNMEREVLFACYAFLHADPDRCREMPGAYLAKNLESCPATLELLTLFIDVTAPSSATIRSCAKTFGLGNPRLNPEDRPKACAALARPGNNSERCTAFKAAVPTAFRGENFKACVDTLDQVTAGLGCDTLDAQNIEVACCRAFAASRKMRAGDSSDCKSDYLCRALGGDATACDAGRDALVAAACVPTRAVRGRAPASPVLMREIDATLSWAAYAPALDPAGRAALGRLHETMLGRRELAPTAAITDLAALRTSAAEEILEQAGPSKAAEELRVRLVAARGRLVR